MINRELISVRSHWCDKIDSLFLVHPENADSLVVLFPGGDGSCDVPLLHYARKAALISGCDVLSLCYGNCIANKQLAPKDLQYIIDESLKAIEICLTKGYKVIFFISKSLGTIVAGEVSKTIDFGNIKSIYLTPLPDAIPHISNSNCIVIVGTKDKWFKSVDLNTLRNSSNVDIKIFEGAAHSLEIDDDYIKSLSILSEVTDICANYVIKG